MEAMTFNEFSAMSGYAFTGVKIADYIAEQKGAQFSEDNLSLVLAHDKDMCVVQGGRTGIAIRVVDKSRRKLVIAGHEIGDWSAWRTNKDQVIPVHPNQTITYTLSETGGGYDHDIIITLLKINPETAPNVMAKSGIEQSAMTVPSEKAGGDGAMYAYQIAVTDVDGITQTAVTTGKQADALAAFNAMNKMPKYNHVQLLENGRIIQTGSGGYVPPDHTNSIMNSDVVTPEDKGVETSVPAPEGATSPIVQMPGIEAAGTTTSTPSPPTQDNMKVAGVFVGLLAVIGVAAYVYWK